MNHSKLFAVFVLVSLLLGPTGNFLPQVNASSSEPSTYSLYFDGDDDYVQVSHHSSLILENDFTFMLWIKPNDLVGAQMFISKYDAGWIPAPIWIELQGESIVLGLGDGEVDEQLMQSNGDGVNALAWNHLVILKESNKVRFYFNATFDEDEETVTVSLADGGFDLYIGADNGVWTELDGFMDDVCIFNRALNVTEISYAFNSGLGRYAPLNITGLMGWWKFDDNSSSTLWDRSGNGNHGAITNATWTSGISPDWYACMHDIAVLSVTPSQTSVVRGEPVNVTVVVKNNGTMTETFDVKVYYDQTAAEWLSETQTVPNLGAGANTSLTLTWNTTDVESGDHTIIAVASEVPDEENTVNNTLESDKKVTVEVPDTIPPVANAGPDLIVTEDTLVTFDGSASTDENGIATYTWTFTDITLQTLSGKNPTYTFATPGTYTVTLKVTDPPGNYATDTVTITVLLDTDGDGTRDVTDSDDDNDGVNDDEDAFPLDPVETVDTDEDGIGNNADTDDDNDGMPDTWETENGLNPLDVADASLDTDGDGLTNLQEYQRDTDPNVSDAQAFPWWILGVVAVVMVGVGATLVIWKLRKPKITTT